MAYWAKCLRPDSIQDSPDCILAYTEDQNDHICTLTHLGSSSGLLWQITCATHLPLCRVAKHIKLPKEANHNKLTISSHSRESRPQLVFI